MATDEAKGKAEETIQVTVTRDTDGTNPEPAYEEGPHLDDPAIRAKKREQMVAHGWDHETEGITPDMAAILKEQG
jgi:hypothetical protein